MEDIRADESKGNKTRLFYSIVVTIIAVISIISASYLNYSNVQMKKEIADNQIMLSSSNSSLKEDIAQLQDQLAKQTQEKVVAEENRKFLEAKIKIVNEEMDKLNVEKEEVSKNYKTTLDEKQELQKNVEELRKQKDELDRKAKEAKKEDVGTTLARKKAELDQSINELKKKLAEKQEKLNTETDASLQASLKEEAAIIEKELGIQEAMKLLLLETMGRAEEVKKGVFSKVELAPIVIQPTDQKKLSSAAKEGKITRIDEANRLVVISLGLKNNLKAGKTIYALRDGKKIAELEVLIARDELSACKIKATDKGFSLKIGDIIAAN